MANFMKRCGAIFSVGTVLLTVLYLYTSREILLSFAITFGTVSYHLLIRLLIGFALRNAGNHPPGRGKSWYRVSEHEKALYDKLKVKKWKSRLPTYDSTLFDPKKHSWDEIARASYHAELIHEAGALLSFPPILAGRWFGAYPVFIITSVLSAAFDMMFAVIQRFNRQRILSFTERTNGRRQSHPDSRT